MPAFPEVRFVLMVRELSSVAASFERRLADRALLDLSLDHRAAVATLSGAVARLRRFDDAGHAERAFVVLYERFFSGETRYARALYEFLGLSFDQQAVQTFLDWT